MGLKLSGLNEVELWLVEGSVGKNKALGPGQDSQGEEAAQSYLSTRTSFSCPCCGLGEQPYLIAHSVGICYTCRLQG